MRKGTFKNPTIDQLGDALNQEKDSLHARSNNIQGSAGGSHNLNPAGPEAVLEKRIIRQPKKQEPPKGPDSTQTKLVSSIREIFLDIRQKTINESPDCALLLKKQIPFEESEERISSSDPLILLHHIKKIFDKVLELKSEAEKEAALRNENDCGDYEGMLQKLEAEIRQHIRIEQQLKLYVESVQAKLEDHEKEGDISKIEHVQVEVENLKQENLGLNEKVKHCKDEITNLKKRMHKKVEMIEKLEKQLENIPVLKKIVREMDRVLDGEPTAWSVQESAPLGSQRSTKELENQSHSNNPSVLANDMKARKKSQPVVVSHTGSQDKNRDSNEYIRVIDASVQFNEGSKRESFGKGKAPKDPGLKPEGSLIKSTGRLEDKVHHDLEDALRKPRKSAKGESNRQNSKEKQQNPDQEGGSSESATYKEMKAIMHARTKEGDKIEQGKFGGDPAFKAGMEEYLKKSFEKNTDHKAAKTKSNYTKKNKTHVLDNSKDKIESLKAPSRKNSASKAMRPSTTAERARHHEHTQHSPEQHHTPDPYKGRESVSNNKRQGHDRSQSVEARKKLVRQHKSRASINEEESEENYKKHQVSFNGHYKGPGYLRANQSGSGTFIRGHN